MNRLISSILIEPFPDKVLLSKNRRPIYYNRENAPKKYLNSPKYFFNGKGTLINASTLTPVIKNSKTANKPRFWKVNFQAIWNGVINKQMRASISNKLSEMVASSLDECPRITQFPLRIELVIYDLESSIDIDNRGVIYHKVFADTLKKLGKIPDDSAEYINDTGRTIYIKVNDEKDIKMLYNIYLNR